MPQNNNYKQDFLAIKYDYDTQCSMSEDVLANYIRELDSKINPQAQGLGTLYGGAIDGEIPVVGKDVRNESTSYWAFDGDYTKLVTVGNMNIGDYKTGESISPYYYIGRYNTYSELNRVPQGKFGQLQKGAYIYRPPAVTNVSNADVSGAFQPIGQYYSNLLDIKKRLNKFLEDASDEIGESQSYLANEERYDNRGHPEKSVTSKEIAYGLFSEVRPSTVPILMALGTFMASVSILMIFQMVGFTSQINVPPAIIAFQTWLATPGQVPAYQNPMILGGIITVLSVAVVLLGLMYLRSRQ